MKQRTFAFLRSAVGIGAGAGMATMAQAASTRRETRAPGGIGWAIFISVRVSPGVRPEARKDPLAFGRRH